MGFLFVLVARTDTDRETDRRDAMLNAAFYGDDCITSAVVWPRSAADAISCKAEMLRRSHARLLTEILRRI